MSKENEIIDESAIELEQDIDTLDDEELSEEELDEVNRVKQALDTIDSAIGAARKASGRKGDNFSTKMAAPPVPKMPGSKAGLAAGIIKTMESMDDDELVSLHNSIVNEETDEVDELPQTRAALFTTLAEKVKTMSKNNLSQMYSTITPLSKKATKEDAETELEDDGEALDEMSRSTLMATIADKMQHMDKDELIAMYTGNSPESNEDVDYAAESDFKEDINQLVAREDNLSEEFKNDAAIIFESVVNSRIAQEINVLNEKYAEELEEEVNEVIETVTEKVNDYLSHAVETWISENQMAIESGLRTQIAEDFMNSLKELFIESYITVPEEKVDLVDGLATELEKNEEKVSDLVNENLRLRAIAEEYKKHEIIRDYSQDLTESQADRLAVMLESADLDEDFERRVVAVKEAHFGEKAEANGNQVITEDDTTDTFEDTLDDSKMNQYLSAVKQAKQ